MVFFFWLPFGGGVWTSEQELAGLCKLRREEWSQMCLITQYCPSYSSQASSFIQVAQEQ